MEGFKSVWPVTVVAGIGGKIVSSQQKLRFPRAAVLPSFASVLYGNKLSLKRKHYASLKRRVI
jgi:hypothetical protein